MTVRTFDRLPEPDDRNRNFPIRALVGSKPLRSYTWNGAPYLDQGQVGACVGHGWAHELAARPVKRPVTSEDAFAIYHDVQKLDPWEGEAYEGTSVLAGAKAVQARGYMAEYRWAFTLEDALLTLGYRGPVVVGCWWYEGMLNADPGGFIHPTGERLGGHCVMVKAVSVPKRRVTVHNSWSRSWAVNGDAYLSFDDFARLIAEDGDVCVPVVRR